jgi:glycerophosphoryl diester phosphodiesterase
MNMKKDKSNILIIGHKGASKTEPGNSLRAFKKAIDLGADFIELDVQFSKDKEIVVFHEYDIKSITGQEVYVNELTVKELQQYDIGQGESIPTLKEVIHLTNGKIGLQIELKELETGNVVIKMLKDADLIDSTIISSFIHNELLNVKKIEPRMRLGALISERISDPLDLKKATKSIIKKKLFAVHPHYKGVNRDLVEFAHNNDLRVNVWTVNEKADIQHMIDVGVDGIISDDIPLVKSLLER